MCQILFFFFFFRNVAFILQNTVTEMQLTHLQLLSQQSKIIKKKQTLIVVKVEFLLAEIVWKEKKNSNQSFARSAQQLECR